MRNRTVLVVLLASSIGMNCIGTGDKVDVPVVTDCPGKAGVTGTATVSRNAAGKTIVHVSLDFTCDGSPLAGTVQFSTRSELPLTPLWPQGSNRQRTGGRGHLEFDVEIPNATPDQVRGSRFTLLFERTGAGTAGTSQSTTDAGEVTIQ